MPDTKQTINVVIAGAMGKMGREALKTLQNDPRFHVNAVLVHNIGQAQEQTDDAILVYNDAMQLIQEVKPDVWLDLTDARSVVAHVDAAIDAGIRPVIGATGYSREDIERWDHACKANGIGGVACPNFAIGALLMMRFATEAARFFPKAEIIELHHDQKRDAPSGTSKRTADAMQDAMQMADEIPIHSIRLPGLVAHQEVLFGGHGEVLTIRHDSMSRQSFMPGVLTACEKVVQLSGLVYGLEHLLW